MEYLLLRHVSALALGHHHVSNFVSEETIQCSIHIIQRDLVDNVTIDNCQENKIKIISYIKRKYSMSKVGVVMG